MNAFNSIFQMAGEREAGTACAHCRTLISLGGPVILCTACGTVHHRDCWHAAGGCGSYVCAPPRRNLGDSAQPALRISVGDLSRVAPLPESRPLVTPRPPIPQGPRRMSRLAIASVVCLILGVPLLEIFHNPIARLCAFLACLAAVILGCAALSGMGQGRRRGLVLALVSVLLSLGSTVFWLIVFANTLGQPQQGLTMLQFRPDPNAFNDLPPKINRAMRANVLIERRNGLLGEGAMGSGVVLKIDNEEAVVITNRHVVDPNFQDHWRGGDPGDLFVDVLMADKSMPKGRIVWMAPGKVDLALVRVPCHDGEVKAARWKMRRRMRVGDPVFAIGNPQELGWTHTQGSISQFRIKEEGGHEVRVIQTQTALNPGNSGGGLYDNDGYLIGINTWAQDKRVSEGLNFAIALDTLLTFPPPGLDLEAGSGDNT